MTLRRMIGVTLLVLTAILGNPTWAQVGSAPVQSTPTDVATPGNESAADASSDWRNKDVRVPNVVGLWRDEAILDVFKAGLRIGDVREETSTSVARDHVIRESPVAGTHVKVGSKVDLVIARAPEVKIPDLAGLTLGAAKAALDKVDLKIGRIEERHSTTVAAGLIISQDPRAGTSVAAKSAVNLVVSSGAAPVTVPNVVGLAQAAATTAITGAGLTLGTVTTTSSGTVAAGLVISESPVAGTSVAAKSAVSLAVSSGPAAVLVPNLVGLTRTAASTAITNAGLTLGAVTTQSSATVAAGLVISESPVAGTSVAAKAAVNLVVSSGAAPVTVPNVVGLTQAAARSAITGAGLTLGTVMTQSSATVTSGLVISETPTAGSSVSAKSAVNLVVSTGPAVVLVPSVVGLTETAATSAITGAGLTLGTVTTQSSATLAAGLVISESPVAGSSVAAKSAVNLVVSSGAALVMVPNLVGLTQAVATSAITGEGLTLGAVATQSSATVAAGLVISESPVAGTNVAAKSAVNLVVSSGPAPVTVPNVVGLTQAAAMTAITGAGLTLGTVTTQSSATVAAGLVISESPVAGTSVAAKFPVNLVVSSGAASVTVPNVVGLTQAAATTAITSDGLTLGTVTTQSSATVAAGLVISESPAAGTSVAVKSAVNLVVSNGAAAVTVPNVVGLTQAAATTAITGAGLTVGVVTMQSSATVAAGLVIGESPVAGTSVAAKSTVNLVVSSGATAVTVPNVVGLTQTATAAAITGAGLTIGTVTSQSSTTVASGRVIREDPVAGSSVAAKFAVNLVVSRGAASGSPVTGSFSGFVYNPATQTVNAVLTLTNNGPTLYPLLSVGISSGSSSVTVKGASTNGSISLANLPNGSLLPSESATFEISFVDPTQTSFVPIVTQITGASAPSGLAVAVTSPTSGQTTAGPTFLVTGTLSAPSAAGVSLDGIPACLVGTGAFFLNAFQPQSSPTSFTATATDIDGGQKSIGVSITQNTKGLRVTPTPACGGIAPFTTTVNVSLDTTDGDTIASETIDFGAGTGAVSATPGTPVQNVYNNADLYKVTVTATTAMGATLTQTALVAVQTQAQAFAPLQSTATLLQAALASQNSVRAASLFAVPVRASYQTLFATLGPQMPQAAKYLSKLTPITLDPALSQAAFPATINGISGYLTIEFAPDWLGIWRVESW